MSRRVPVVLLAVSSISLAQDITVENHNAIVPENAVPGLVGHVGQPLSQAFPGSFPDGLLDAMEFPSLTTYMGMSRNRAPESLRYHFSQVIEGRPGTQSIFDDRFAIFSACRAGSCPEKGWFMTNLGFTEYVGAIRHFYWGEEETGAQGSLLIFSVDFESYEEIPDLYLQSLSHWAEGIFADDYDDDSNFAIVRFVNSAGTIETVCTDCMPR